MSGDQSDENRMYKLNELEDLSLNEVRTLYRKVVAEIKEAKLEFEEYQCKFTNKMERIAWVVEYSN